MAGEELSAEQKQARALFEKALQEAERGHIDRAMQLAVEALEFDADFIECRRWLAERYEERGELRKASRQLQEILYRRRSDHAAWEALERIDPQAAARIRRVAEIGPDPFVARRKVDLGEIGLIADMEEVVQEAPQEEEPVIEPDPEHLALIGDAEELEEAAEPALEEPQVSAERREQILREILAETEPEAEEEQEEEPEPVMEEAPPQPWEYEQDRPYREKMMANELLKTVHDRIVGTYPDHDRWRQVLDACTHAREATHKELWAAAREAAQVLGAPEPELFLVAEGKPHSVALRPTEREIAVSTGVLRAMEGAMLTFVLGRLIGMHVSGCTPLFMTALLATDRPSTLMGACEDALREFLWDVVGDWFESHSREQRQSAAALAHAWQLRCELTADRAGLLACGNLEAACNAIARMTRRSAAQAEDFTWQALQAELKGEDARSLADIPVKEDPRYNAKYGLYRIKMLRWWFTTDQYKQLAERLRGD